MRIRKYIIIVLCLICFIFTSSQIQAHQIREPSTIKLTSKERAWLNAHHEIRIGIMNEWPPVNYVDVQGNPKGIGVDLIVFLNQSMGNVLKIVPGSFKDNLSNIKEKKLDVLMDVTPKPEREVFLNFTRPYLVIPHVFIGRHGGPYYKTEDELIGKVVALEKGFYNVRYFKKEHPAVTVREYPNTSLALDAVSKGDADAYAGNRAVATWIIDKEVLHNLQIQGRMSRARSKLAFGVRKDWPELASIIDKILDSMPENEYRKIFSKWTGIKASEESDLLKLTADQNDWLAAHPKIRIGVDADYAPYSFRDNQGRYLGIAMEFGDYLSNELGLQMEVVPNLTWPQIVDGVKERDLDVVITMSHRLEREAFVNFTEIYLPTPLVIMRRSGETNIQTEADIAGRRVALVEGYSSSKRVMEEYPTVIPLIVKTAKEGLFAVSIGKADAYVGVLGINLHVAEKNGIPNLEMASVYGDGTNGQRFGVRKDWPELASILDKALKAIPGATKRKFFDRWLPTQAAVLPTRIQSTQPETISLSQEEKTWLKAHPVIRFTGNPDWLPFEAFNVNGDYIGIVADHLKLFEDKLGVKFERVPTKDWSESIQKAMSYDVDVTTGCAGSVTTPQFMFTDAFLSSPIVLMMPKGITSSSGMEGLSGKWVAVARDHGYAQDIIKIHPEIPYLFTDNVRKGLESVATGQVDAMVSSLAIGGYLLNELNLHNVHVGGTTDFTMNLGLAVRKDWPQLHSILNKAIQSVTVEERTRIMSRWGAFRYAGKGQQAVSEPKIALTEIEKAWLRQHRVFRVHNEQDWPPYNFNRNDQPLGFSIDYMNIVADKLGIKVEYVSGPIWDEFMGMVKKGAIDVMLNIAKSPEREKFLNYTSPYHTLSQRILFRSGDGPFQRIEDLETLKVAVIKGFRIVSFLKENYPEMKLVYFEDTVEAMLAVARGEAGAYIGDFSVLNYLMIKHRITDLIISPALDRKNIPTGNLHIGVRKDWNIFAKVIDKAMANISPQELVRLEKKWMAPRQTSAPSEAGIQSDLWFLIGAAVIFQIMLIGAWLLSRRIKDELLTRQFGTVGFRQKVYAGMSLMAAVVGVLVWYTLDQNKKTTLISIRNELKVVLLNTMERHEIWIDQNKNILRQLGRNTELVAITKRLLRVPSEPDALKKSRPLADAREFFTKIEAEFGKIGFFIINKDNVSIGSMRDSNLGTKNLIAEQKPELLSEVFKGIPKFIPPIRSDVILQPASGEEVNPQRPLTMFFAAPIRDSEGDVIAVLTQRLLPSQNMTRITNSGRIGQSGESYIVNSSGQLVTDSRFQANLHKIGLIDQVRPFGEIIEVRNPGANMVEGHSPSTPRSEQPFTRMAEDLLRQANDTTEKNLSGLQSQIRVDMTGYRDYRGVPVLGAWIWMPHLDLGMTTEIDVDEALAGYYTSRQNLLIISGLILMSAIIALLLTLRLGERAARVLRRTQMDLENQVNERTERLRTIIDTAVDGIIVLDLLGVIRSFSPAAEVMFGYSSGEVEGHNIKMLVPQVVEGKLDKFLRQYSENGDKRLMGRSVEEIGKRKDGKSFPIEYTVAEGRLEQESFLTAIVRDITDRKNAEEELKKLSRAVEQSPASVVITDLNGNIEYVNPKFIEVTGYGTEEAIGQNPRILSSGRQSPEYYQEMWKTLKDGNEWHGEFENKRKDGKHYWAKASISPIVNQRGEITHFVASQEDITARKKADAELARYTKALEKANSDLEESQKKAVELMQTAQAERRRTEVALFELQESEAYNRLLIDNFPIGLAECRMDGELVSLNDVYAKIIGRTIKETLELSYWDITPEDYADQEQEQLGSLEKTGRYGPYLKEYLHKDGHRVPVRLRGSLITRRDEQFIWSTVEDITEENRAKEKLQIAMNKAESATKAKSEFLANMSHEIRTPMNAVLGFLELALEDTTLTSQLRKYLSTAQTSASVLLGVINDILDISKLESGKLTIEQRPFYISRMLHQIQSTMNVAARSKGLYLQIDIQSSVSGVFESDPLRLRQILMNIVGNAIKFTKEGGVNVRVVPADEKHHIHFIIADTGIGIPADRIETIFETFTQADTSTTRHFGGTGLGTTISRDLVELMGGRIWVESEVGKGSVFHFTLPMPPSDQVPEEQDLFVVPGKAIQAGPRRGFRILLVEDVEANMELATYRLKQHGHTVTEAWNGRDAVEVFQQGGIDLILMDIQMPVMGGVEATERIRALEADTRGHVPIIAMTAAVMKQETEKYLAVGMDAVVAKPIDFGKLFRVIESVVPEGVGEKISEFKTEGDTIGQPEAVQAQTAEDVFSASDLPGILIKSGLRRVAGNKKLYKKMLNRFKDQYATSVDDIKAHLEKGDVEGALRLAHTVKGVSGSLGAETLFQVAGKLEKAIEKGEPNEMNPLFETFERHLYNVTSGIAAFEQKEAQNEPEAMPIEMETIDKKTILRQLAEIAEFLKSDFMEAMNRLETLKPHLENSEISKEYRQLERQVEGFDTIGALKTLKEIMNTLNPSSEGRH